jgi:hypothetical protein
LLKIEHTIKTMIPRIKIFFITLLLSLIQN